MIIFDIETSGVDPKAHGILSIGGVDFNNPERRFYEECRLRDDAQVSSESQVINGYTLEQIHDASKQSEKELVEHFIAWAMDTNDHTLAGQNPLFDISFLQDACVRHGLAFPFPHRSIDLHSICFGDMVKQGRIPPLEKNRTALNSDVIMDYAGLPSEPKPHIAINGALYEAEAFARILQNHNLLPEFKDYPLK